MYKTPTSNEYQWGWDNHCHIHQKNCFTLVVQNTTMFWRNKLSVNSCNFSHYVDTEDMSPRYHQSSSSLSSSPRRSADSITSWISFLGGPSKSVFSTPTSDNIHSSSTIDQARCVKKKHGWEERSNIDIPLCTDIFHFIKLKYTIILYTASNYIQVWFFLRLLF